MPSAGTDPETLLIRTTVVSVALQALIGRLVGDGILDAGDLVAMREIGLQLAADLMDQGGSGAQVAGERMEREVDAWWDVAGTLGGQ
jgi:hypothetical protein